MQRSPIGLLIAMSSLAIANNLHADIYSISSGHGCNVYNGVDGDSLSYTAPSSPFSHAHTLQFTDWNCQSQHAGSYDAQQGNISMNDSLQAKDIGDYTFSLSAGGFGFRTDVDVQVSYQGVMNYSLPGNSSDASITFYADRYDFPSGQNTTLWSDYDGLVAPNPATGTAQVSGSFLLPALTTDSFYYLSLGMNLYTNSKFNDTDDFLTADGAMEISYSTVPEPASILCMTAPVSILFWKRTARPAC